MSGMKPKPRPERTCWDCRAPNDPNASECWLCGRRDWSRDPRSRPRSTLAPMPVRDPLTTVRGLPGTPRHRAADRTPVRDDTIGGWATLVFGYLIFQLIRLFFAHGMKPRRR